MGCPKPLKRHRFLKKADPKDNMQAIPEPIEPLWLSPSNLQSCRTMQQIPTRGASIFLADALAGTDVWVKGHLTSL